MASESEYSQFCPLARACEVVAVKWNALILREISLGSTGFNDIHRGVPQMSTALLASRLKMLEGFEVIKRHSEGPGKKSHYTLTASGVRLAPALMMLTEWGRTDLGGTIRDGDLNVYYLMWDIHRGLDVAALAIRPRVTLAFDIDGARPDPKYWWMVVENGTVDLCMKDPGYEPDLYLNAGNRDLTEVWMGLVPLRGALNSGLIRLDGDRELIDSFAEWFCLSLTLRNPATGVEIPFG